MHHPWMGTPLSRHRRCWPHTCGNKCTTIGWAPACQGTGAAGSTLVAIDAPPLDGHPRVKAGTGAAGPTLVAIEAPPLDGHPRVKAQALLAPHLSTCGNSCTTIRWAPACQGTGAAGPTLAAIDAPTANRSLIFAQVSANNRDEYT